MRGGIPGGQEAAKRLLTAVRDEYKYEADFDHREAIVIKIYANIKGLAQTYDEQGIASTTEVADFITGFNKVFPLCDLIDAGNAKDGADRKVQSTFSCLLTGALKIYEFDRPTD